MGQEILYTSAPQGLRAGASGYCTVCSTAGMEPNLAEFLEGFSGYPHPFKPPDPRTRDNPVNYSHIQWTIGGQRFFVLSRVCDAGLDYTGRTNLLAHHVALTRREIDRCPGGPAWVMAADSFFFSQWDGQLRTVPGQKPRADDVPLTRCTAWERAAGDAGYAGVLAETAKDKGRPAIIVYPAGMDVLPLVVEAQSLLPPDRRWNVTFTTFSSRIYSSFDVQWRFVFAETADARQARRDPHALVLDLSSGPLPAAQGGPLVAAAREGRLANRPAPPIRPSREGAGGATGSGRRRPAAPLEVANGSDLRLLPPEFIPEDPAAPPPAEVKVSPFERARHKQRSAWVHYAIAFVGGTALALVFFVLLALSGGQDDGVVTNPVQPPLVPDRNPIDNDTQPETPVTPHPEKDKPIEPQPPVEPVTPPVESGPKYVPPDPPTPMPPPPSPKAPFEDFLVHEFPLPKYKSGGIGGSASSPFESPDVKIYVPQHETCVLELLGIEEVFGDKDALLVETNQKGNDVVWTITKPKVGLSKPQQMAEFRLKDQKFSFAWKSGVPPSAQPDLLRFCLLNLRVGTDVKTLQMSSPENPKAISLVEIPPGPIDLAHLNTSNLAGTSSLLLEIRLKDVEAAFAADPNKPIKLGQEQKILINGGDEEAKGARIGLLVQFGAADVSDAKKGALRVSSKVTYKDSKGKDEAALRSSHESLDLEKITRAAKEERDQVNGFDTQLKSAKRQTKENQAKAKQILAADKTLIAERENMVARAKEEKDRNIYQELLKQAIEKLKQHEEEIDAKEREIQAKVDKAEKEAKQAEAVLELANKVCRKGRLEFRIYFTIGEKDVEMYRTLGFSN